MTDTASKSTQVATKRIGLTLTTELIEAMNTKATKLFGNRKGKVSVYAEMVLREDLNMNVKEVDSP